MQLIKFQKMMDPNTKGDEEAKVVVEEVEMEEMEEGEDEVEEDGVDGVVVEAEAEAEEGVVLTREEEGNSHDFFPYKLTNL